MNRDSKPETATQMLRCQHRHLEQALALLEDLETTSSEPDFATVAADLTAHLDAEADVYYSAAEAALGRPLTEQRRHHGRVRQALAAACLGGPKSFARRLFDLAEALKAHSYAEESAIHASLEGVMGDRQLAALGAKLAVRCSAGRRATP
jgi:hypothetical protein